MASRQAHAEIIRRCHAAARVLMPRARPTGQRGRSPSSHRSAAALFARPLSSAPSKAAVGDQSPQLRRRRKTKTGPSAAHDPDSSRSVPRPRDADADPPIGADGASSSFAPRDRDGNLLDAQEYLSLASMSPWVPCPDLVVRRVLDIAGAGKGDVHADLGCGDGRICFAAQGIGVDRSWGVDVDPNILARCRDRMGRRFVPARGHGDVVGEVMEGERLEFLEADLIRVIENQREKYHKRASGGTSLSSKEPAQDGIDEEGSKEECEITRKLSRSTVITMYFVHDALQQLQPYLESVLGGKENVRVVTVGYEMKGWEPTWVERVLGLTVFKYDMGGMSSEPSNWGVGEKEDEQKNVEHEDGVASPETSVQSLDLGADYNDIDESAELAEYLRKKREQDMEDLKGLEIHHDDQLDDFTQARSKRAALEDEADDLNNKDWDEDFDETEEPEDMMRRAQRETKETKKRDRGRGIRAGLRGDEGLGQGEKTSPNVWKNPKN